MEDVSEDGDRARARLVQLGLIGLSVALLAVYSLRILRVGDQGFTEFADLWVYNAALLLIASVCVVRAVAIPGGRAAWAAFALGLITWAAGDIYWSIAFTGAKDVPYPSPADIGYLATIPCFFVGIALLTKRHVGHFRAASWLDGAIGGLAAAALGAAVLAPALVGLTEGDAAAVVTNMAYPLGDLLLLGFVVAALLIAGRQDAYDLLLIGAGLVVWAVADVIYLLLEATSSYRAGWLDLLWPAGALLLASASCFVVPAARERSRGRSTVVFPAIFAAIALAILTIDHFDRVHEAAVWLAIAALLAIVLRLALSFLENESLVRTLRAEAVTDALTGLGNRRRLFAELDEAVIDPSAPHRVLAVFDLDGFKNYNDSFGHPAGDALLRRLGAKLRAAMEGHGDVFRLGGDEFCILVDANERTAEGIVAAARDALTEQGEGFRVGASCGSVVLPAPRLTSSEAMRIADEAMYDEKATRKGRIENQTRDVLLRILREREPRLSDHVHDVAALARGMAETVGLQSEDMDVLVRAAELHDVGKIAIPEEILHKPGPLDELEWELMRKHTLIGERILGAAPAMAPIASAVRSSHERWDGGGYPDGLAGEDIPLLSRIVFICDAFDAMRSDRAYRTAVSEPEAIAELRRNRGTQFDPDLVDVFCDLYENRVTTAGEPVRGRA